MAKKREEATRRVSFAVSTKERPAFKEELHAYVFDSRGELVDNAPVRDGKVEVSLSSGGLGRSRVFIAPLDEKLQGQRVRLSQLERLGAYEPVLLQGPNGLLDQIQIPGIIIDKWPFCFCWVRGHVVRSSDNRAVCNARVHICEVDPIPWLIVRLPDPEIFRLRDDLLDILRNPPIPRRWPIPDPDPGPLRGPRPGPGPDPAPFANPLFRFDVDPGSIVGFNPQPDPPRTRAVLSQRESALSRVALNPQPLPPRSRSVVSDRLSRVALNPQPLPPRSLAIQLSPELSASLQSTSSLVVRDALVANWKLIIPWICYWPWWWRRFRCDEVAVLTTDAHGRFETAIFYPCGGDQPDLYFWVEYDFGSGFETVYHPWIACNTYWNYVCGTDVTIRVSDPRVPGCEDEPDLPGCQVVVLSLGRIVAVRQVQTSGTTQGLTTGGAPFGGSLEPRLDFSRTELITNKNIPYYRWSYRRLTAPDGGGGPVDAGSVPLNSWFVMTREVVRHYKVGTSYPPFFIGPMPTSGTDAAPIPNLFRIRPLDPPAPSPEWIVLDERVDLATSYFDTASLAGAPVGAAPTTDDLAAGRYEIKLELFDAAGNLVNWTAQGIDLRITDQDAPFGTGTITTSPAPNINRVLSGSDTVGFRMTLRVDNNRCFADILAVGGDVTPDPDCGFHNYDSTSDNANLSFVARHPNHFATYSFDVVRGSGAVHPVTTGGVSGEAGVSPFSLGAGFTYDADITVATLLAGSTCENAAFSELLNMQTMATDGYSALSGYNHGDHAAFAVAKPCDCSGQQGQGHGGGQGQNQG